MIKKFSTRLMLELEAEKPSRAFGKGWISGVLALTLSGLSLMAVICFLAPGIFTNLPFLYDSNYVMYIRMGLQMVLIIAFLLACISMILRESKVLGVASAILVFFSLALGGASAKEFVTVNSFAYFGLDWFIVSLILSSVVFIPLERLFYRVDKPIFRPHWREDLMYFFVGTVMVQSISFMTLFPSNGLKEIIDFSYISHMLQAQPFLLQLLEVMFFTDFVQYWCHRFMHQVPALWKFHSVHHSVKSMDWIVSNKVHAVELILTRGIIIIPLRVLGFDPLVISSYFIILYFYSSFHHSNVKFCLNWMNYLFVTPRFHHWHHAIEKEAINKNLAIHFPILDIIFGTYYLPKNRWPKGYGIHKNSMPSGFFHQLIYPFKMILLKLF